MRTLDIIRRPNAGNGGASVLVREDYEGIKNPLTLGEIFLAPGSAVESAIDLIEKATGQQVPYGTKQQLRAMVRRK